jgi:hypothetical protein
MHLPIYGSDQPVALAGRGNACTSCGRCIEQHPAFGKASPPLMGKTGHPGSPSHPQRLLARIASSIEPVALKTAASGTGGETTKGFARFGASGRQSGPICTKEYRIMSTTSRDRAMSTTTGNQALAWILLAIGVAAAIAGIFFGWYSSLWWFDEAIHAYNFFAITLVVALYMYGAVLTGAYRHAFLLILTVALIAVGLGGLWEVGEWLYDTLATQQNTIKSLPDRLIDLIMDGIGGLVAGWVAVSMVKKS